MEKKLKYFILFFISFLTVHCYKAASFRLYNLNKSEILEISLIDGLKTQGIIDSVFFNNEIFNGEYLFHLSKNKHPYSYNYQAKADTQRTVIPADYITFSDSLLTIYGFSKDTSVIPVGFLVISGNKGTVIDVIFYMFYYERGIASGIGKDNKGNIFRVFLTDKE